MSKRVLSSKRPQKSCCWQKAIQNNLKNVFKNWSLNTIGWKQTTRRCQNWSPRMIAVRGHQLKKSFALLNVFQQILPQKQLIYQAFFVWPQSGAARRPQSQRLRNQLYYIKVAQIKKSSRICYTSFKSFSSKSVRILWLLLYNKVDFRVLRPPCSARLRPKEKCLVD